MFCTKSPQSGNGLKGQRSDLKFPSTSAAIFSERLGRPRRRGAQARERGGGGALHHPPPFQRSLCAEELGSPRSMAMASEVTAKGLDPLQGDGPASGFPAQPLRPPAA